MADTTNAVPLIDANGLLAHWQGHRRLTRRVIEAFPEDQLFSFSIGGMRPFGVLAREFLGMAVPIVEGVATGQWQPWGYAEPSSRADLLKAWDEQTAILNRRFPEIPPARFAERDKAFGQWEMTGLEMIQYAMDNEIHHRGQGYVYLRALGVEPPAFWER